MSMTLGLPLLAGAQVTRDGELRKPMREVVVKHRTPPKWAEAHGYHDDKYVYFPDYYIFYSPIRGYVYWSNNGWTTSQANPQYTSDMDLIEARAEILNNVPLDNYPERRIGNYMKQYPGNPTNRDGIPVPPER